MKKSIILAAMAALALSASAEGYQVNTFSSKQLGMGHAGVAMKLGAESILFNPGALAMSDKTFELSGSITAISADAWANSNGVKYETDNDISTPMNISSAFKIYDNFYGGIALFTPYGSGINWGEHWPGAVLNQNVKIKVFTVQPTVSWRPLKNLSVGAGLMINWGSVDLSKALLTGASLNPLLKAMGMPDEAMYPSEAAPASVNLKGSSNLALGFSVGALWDINKQWSLGLSFRSRSLLTVEKGDARVSYSGAAEEMLTPILDNLNNTNFHASLPAPYVLTLGTAFKPIDNVTIALDVQLNGWKTYKSLNIEFDDLEDFNQSLTKNYKNCLTYHVGAQWGVTKRCDLRCGLMIDTNPCDKNFYNPETPGQLRIEPSVGLSFRPMKNLSIDLAFMYVHGCGTDNATGVYDNLVYKVATAAQMTPEMLNALGIKPQGSFSADYKVRAYMPSFGLSYSF